jgi:hypothetical protein
LLAASLFRGTGQQGVVDPEKLFNLGLQHGMPLLYKSKDLAPLPA